jgi:beta-glucanase (GH16 family)
MTKRNLGVVAAVAVLGAACGSSSKGGETPPPPPEDTCTACQYHRLVWSDEFDGTGQPSAANWNYHVGNGWNPGNGGYWDGWGNQEWEWYRPENCYQQDGKLVIRGDYNDTAQTPAGKTSYQYSCRITTQGKQAWQNARLEARIAMPAKAAIWPAFWAMGEGNNGTYATSYHPDANYYDTMSGNWSSCGEIDIMEHKNADTVTTQNLFWDSGTTLHPWTNGTNLDDPGSAEVGDVTAFHKYAVEVDATTIKWFIDDQVVKTKDVSAANMEEFRQKFFVILNMAIDGQFVNGGGPNVDPNKADFPLYMYVDYVRVYQQ